MNYTCWFSDGSAAKTAYTGGKGANLSRLVSAGFPVPPGFCVTADAYRFLLEVTGLTPVIEGILETIDFEDPLEVDDKAAAIRDLFEQQPVPNVIASEILENYFNLGRQLGTRHLEATPVAVRSSATAEDLPDASFAGQQDTYLNVRGGYAVLDHVRRCWASMWTARALTYRQRKGYDHHKVAIAVVVQAMINPSTSGILFTANPLSGARNECMINASWGLGEAIVSGIVTPDTYVVDKANGRILDEDIAVKERQVSYAPHGGAVETEVEGDQRNARALQPEEVAHLTALATRIEEYYGSPQDIEWALLDGDWYILQARPITTLDDEMHVSGDETFSRAMFVEIFPEGISPSFLSVVCPLLANMLDVAFTTLGFDHRPHRDGVRPFQNQPYLNITYIEEVLQDTDPAVRRQLVAKFSNIFAAEKERPSFSITQLRLAFRLFQFVRRFRSTLPLLLAEYQSEIQRISALDLSQESDEQLLQHVRHICYTGAGPLLNNDFLLIASIGVFRTLLTRLLQPIYADRTEEVLAGLLSGVSGNIIMETNKLIWNLAQTARLSPPAAQVILESEPGEAVQRLRSMPEAVPFLDQLDQLLAVCGHREQHFDILYPTWGEEPAPVIAFVRSYLEAEHATSPQEREEELIAQREAATTAVMQQLGRGLNGRLLRLPLFTYLLQQTQWLARQRDTMHFEWTRIFPPARRMQLEIGRRWQALGLIDEPEDIFFMTLEEQEKQASSPQPRHDLVAKRRAEYTANVFGPWPDVVAPGQTLEKQLESVISHADAAPGSLTGIAGSPGFATGPARIISSPSDFSRLRPGEILVAPMTNPVWTPLFAIAGGIITETGGVLSHGAIVAREYGIPAVMSLVGATSLLRDGEQVAVDGSRGLVLRETNNGSHAQIRANPHISGKQLQNNAVKL